MPLSNCGIEKMAKKYVFAVVWRTLGNGPYWNQCNVMMLYI
jgi:hypothetical protein